MTVLLGLFNSYDSVFSVYFKLQTATNLFVEGYVVVVLVRNSVYPRKVRVPVLARGQRILL